MKYEKYSQYSHGQPQLGEVAAPGHGHQLGVVTGHRQLTLQLQGAATTLLHRRYKVRISRSGYPGVDIQVRMSLYLQTCASLSQHQAATTRPLAARSSTTTSWQQGDTCSRQCVDNCSRQ